MALGPIHRHRRSRRRYSNRAVRLRRSASIRVDVRRRQTRWKTLSTDRRRCPLFKDDVVEQSTINAPTHSHLA